MGKFCLFAIDPASTSTFLIAFAILGWTVWIAFSHWLTTARNSQLDAGKMMEAQLVPNRGLIIQLLKLSANFQPSIGSLRVQPNRFIAIVEIWDSRRWAALFFRHWLKRKSICNQIRIKNVFAFAVIKFLLSSRVRTWDWRFYFIPSSTTAESFMWRILIESISILLRWIYWISRGKKTT